MPKAWYSICSRLIGSPQARHSSPDPKLTLMVFESIAGSLPSSIRRRMKARKDASRN
jgi:hypothetical protein